MESLVKELLSQAPALAVLCFVVVTFIKSLDKRDVLVAQMHSESMAERQESRKVIRENANATAENTAALNNLAHVIKTQKPT